jgi:hypothetical protein
MNHLCSPQATKRLLRILSLAAFALLCMTVAIGCKTSSFSETTLQGVKVKILHPEAPPISHTHEGHGEAGKQYDKDVVSWEGANPGRVEVVIEDLRLRVNGQDYFTVAVGDVVTIDVTKKGEVTVTKTFPLK